MGYQETYFVLKKATFLDKIVFPEIIQLNNISESRISAMKEKNRVGILENNKKEEQEKGLFAMIILQDGPSNELIVRLVDQI